MFLSNFASLVRAFFCAHSLIVWVTFSYPAGWFSSHQLEGQWTWEDPQTLTHKANTLLGSSVYSFRVSPHEEAVSVFGATLQRERQVKFTTPRLTVSHSTPTEICTSLNPTCVLGFNQRVDPFPYVFTFNGVTMREPAGGVSLA